MHFFTRVLSPAFFNTITPAGLVLLLVGSAVMIAGMVWGAVFAPADYLQGQTVRIMYIHVPMAMASMAAYMLAAVVGIFYLIYKIKVLWFIFEALLIPGLIATLIALATGALWGKPMWGTWWIWDARLTSECILAFLYVLTYVFAQQNRVYACLFAIVGAVDVPLIHYSVQWFNTLHQGASLKMGSSAIHPAMLYPLLLCIAGAFIGGIGYVLVDAALSIKNHKKREERLYAIHAQ